MNCVVAHFYSMCVLIIIAQNKITYCIIKIPYWYYYSFIIYYILRSWNTVLWEKKKHSLAFSIVPTALDAAAVTDVEDDVDPLVVGALSLDMQQLQIIPPLHKSTGFPPSSTHDILSPQSNLLPLYQHVWGITVWIM